MSSQHHTVPDVQMCIILTLNCMNMCRMCIVCRMYTMHWSPCENNIVCSEHVCFCSVSTWRAGWTWSSTGGLLRRTKLSDRRGRLILQPNTSTGSTSLALTAPPQQNNRMMYVSQSHDLKNNMFRFIGECTHSGLVTTPLKLNYCQLPGKAWERQGQKHGAHDITNPRWDVSSSWGSTSRCDKQRLLRLSHNFPISLLWHPGDVMLTALTAGCLWETGRMRGHG